MDALQNKQSVLVCVFTASSRQFGQSAADNYYFLLRIAARLVSRFPRSGRQSHTVRKRFSSKDDDDDDGDGVGLHPLIHRTTRKLAECCIK